MLAGASGVTEAILGNWQVNGIVRARTGLPLAMSMASNQSGTALGNRPNQTCSGELAPDQRAVTKWFDTSCYVAPAAGTFGNAPRTMPFSGPGLANVDMSLFKNFPLSNGSRLQFRAEVFNLFNRANFTAWQLNESNSLFGQPTAAGGIGYAPRVIQFGIRARF